MLVVFHFAEDFVVSVRHQSHTTNQRFFPFKKAIHFQKHHRDFEVNRLSVLQVSHTHAQRVNGDDVEKCLCIPWTHSLDLIIRFRAFHLNNPRTFPVLSPSSRWRTTEHFPSYQPDTWTSALPIFTQNPSRPFPVSRPCVISVHNIHSWLIYASSLSRSPLKAIPLLNFMPVITLLCIKHPIVCSCF